MKRLFLMLFAAIAVSVTCCSQSKSQSGTKGTQEEKAIAQTVDGKVGYLTTADFKKKVMDYDKHPKEWVFKGKRPVIIDFYTTWCRPCKMTAPILEELAKDYQGKIDFYKVDVDKEKELAAVFGIQSIPSFLFVPAEGKPTMQMGAMQKADFEKIIKDLPGK